MMYYIFIRTRVLDLPNQNSPFLLHIATEERVESLTSVKKPFIKLICAVRKRPSSPWRSTTCDAVAIIRGVGYLTQGPTIKINHPTDTFSFLVFDNIPGLGTEFCYIVHRHRK